MNGSPQKPDPKARVRHLLLGHGLALGCAMVFALNLSLIKVAREDLGALELAGARFWIAGLVAMGLWCVRGWPRWRGWDRRAWWWVGMGAVLLGPVFLIMLNTGAVGTSAGLMGVLMATQALHLAWMGPLFVGEAVGVRQLMALGVSFIGIALPLTLGGEVAFSIWWAPLLVGLASGLGAMNVVIPKVLHGRVETVDLATTILVIAAIFMLPLMGARGEFHQFREMSVTTGLAVLWMGSFGQIGVLVLWYTAMRRLTAVTAALYLFVLMLASSVWGLLLLGEVPHWSEGLAAVVVLVALRINAAGGKAARRREAARAAARANAADGSSRTAEAT